MCTRWLTWGLQMRVCCGYGLMVDYRTLTDSCTCILDPGTRSQHTTTKQDVKTLAESW